MQKYIVIDNDNFDSLACSVLRIMKNIFSVNDHKIMFNDNCSNIYKL